MWMLSEVAAIRLEDVPLPEKEEQELLGQQRRLLLQALTHGPQRES